MPAPVVTFMRLPGDTVSPGEQIMVPIAGLSVTATMLPIGEYAAIGGFISHVAWAAPFAVCVFPGMR